MSLNSKGIYKERRDVIKCCFLNLKSSHIRMTYVTVNLTEVTRVKMNMYQVNIQIKKNVTLYLHLKPILMVGEADSEREGWGL